MREWWLRFKRNYLPTPMAYGAKYLLKLIFSTCKIKVEGLENLSDATKSQSCLMMLWHNRIVMTCEFFERYAPQMCYTAFLSNSRDGEPIQKLLDSYATAKSIRVAHDSKHKALHKMIKLLKSPNELILVTPDGPKGPALQIKPGIVMAAQIAACPVIPFNWSSTKYFEFRTWDKFRLPKPFSTITIKIGQPVMVPRDLAQADAAALLQQAMQALENVHSN